MDVKVISVFAGLGKTTVGNKYENVCDLQSSPFRCDYSKIDPKDYEKMKYNKSRLKNPEWPNNYLKAMKESMDKYDLVLVPSSLDVRELLIKNNIKFLFVLPPKDNKTRKMLLERYQMRGNSKSLITDVMNNFDNWSRSEKDYDYPIAILESDKYLEDLLIDLNLINPKNKDK